MNSIFSSRSQRFLMDLERINDKLNRSTAQLSSGLRVTRPSDSPADVADILSIQQRKGSLEQGLANLKNLQTDIETAESVLSGCQDLLDSATRLAATVPGGESDADQVAEAIRHIQEQVVAATQTQVAGRYLFSGDRDHDSLYTLDTNLANGVSAAFVPCNTRLVSDGLGGTLSPGFTAQQIFDDPNGSIFSALNDLRIAVSNKDNDAIAAAIQEVNAGSDVLMSHLSAYGAIQERLDYSVNQVHQLDNQAQKELSGVRDADIAQSIMDLTGATIAREAALGAQSRIPQKSLFDYLA